MGASEEIELKLSLTPKNLDRLQRSALVRSLASSRASTKQLVSTYFDTPDQDLRRRGMALRVRHIGKKRIQTLKALADRAGGGLQRNHEYEVELRRDAPDLSLVDNDDLQALFAREAIAEQLEPVFSTRVSRHTVPLRVDDSEVELAIDRGEIKSGRRRLPIAEAELELLSGRPERLYELALRLHDAIPFRLERRTKAARGYGLRQQERPRPVKAAAIQLDPGMTAADAFVAAARSCLAQIRANELVALAGADLEGVHQLRVGARRLRAVIAVFRGTIDKKVRRYLSTELQWLLQQLGPARDWDVFIHETIEPLQKLQSDEASLVALHEAAKAARTRGYRQMRRTLTAGRFTAFLLHLELWLDDGGWRSETDSKGKAKRPVCLQAAKALARQDRSLHALAGQHVELSEAELHQVRLKAKRMRYSVEIFRSLFPAKAVKRQLMALETIQDALGSLNDAVVSRELLAALLRNETRRDPAAAVPLNRACDIVRAWHDARIARDRDSFASAWKRYCKAPSCWLA